MAIIRDSTTVSDVYRLMKKYGNLGGWDTGERGMTRLQNSDFIPHLSPYLSPWSFRLASQYTMQLEMIDMRNRKGAEARELAITKVETP